MRKSVKKVLSGIMAGMMILTACARFCVGGELYAWPGYRKG